MNNQKLVQRDLAAIWHPCTQMKDHETLPLIPIQRGNGVWLQDYNGNRYIDAISSWWVNIFGHNNQYINAAIVEQLNTLEHVIFAGFSHEPAVTLAERLVDITPKGLTRCFFADNGSAAVEAALKMSFHYWYNLEKKTKTKFVSLSNSYHGETLGALSVGDVALYKQTYQPLLLQSITVASPDAYQREPGESQVEVALRKFAEIEQVLEQRSHEICAVIVEPLVQCAGGMRMYDPIYLAKLKEICSAHEVHLIADEIAVGFGRTGTLFACEQADISPDFLCLSKGLTGGYLPLSVVMTNETVYQAFYDDYEKLTAFLHSHSYTGNPLACQAAIATLDIFQRDDIILRNKLLAREMEKATASLKDHPHVAEVRQTGMILAIEMVKNKRTRAVFPWQERRGLRVYQYALKHEALLRPLGNVVYFMPPYVISPEEIHQLAQVATAGIDFATAGD